MKVNQIDELSEALRKIEDAHEHTDAAFIALDYIRQHHTAIRRDAEDASRWRKVRDCDGLIGVYEGLSSGDCGLALLTGDEADAAIDAAIKKNGRG